MATRKKERNTHISKQIKILHGALLDIVSVMNHPQVDEIMIREAGISLDHDLFPLVTSIGKVGPIGIVELANRTGRNYTTVSRQILKLETAGLVARQAAATDRRVHKVVLTSKGKTMTNMVDAARDRIGRAIFESWEEQDIDELVRLLRKFADAMGNGFSINS